MGESAWAAWKGESFQRAKPIYWQWRGGDNQDFTWPSNGVRDGDWKLLVSSKQNKKELYNLKEDWSEKHDVSADHPEIVQRLSSQLEAWESSLPEQPSENAVSKNRKKKR